MSEENKNDNFSMTALAFFMSSGIFLVISFVILFIAMGVFGSWGYAKEKAWVFSLGIALAGGIIFSAFVSSAEEEAKKTIARMKKIKDETGFGGDKKYSNPNFYIELHQEKDRILIIEKDAHLVINKDEIVDTELYIDDSVVSRSTSNSGLAGAAVGGLLAGGAGAIVGAIASKKNNTTTSNTIDNIAIKIITSNIGSHYVELTFHTGYGLEKGSKNLKEILDAANDWHALFTALMHSSQRKEIA